jgi:hypothetical protein
MDSTNNSADQPDSADWLLIIGRLLPWDVLPGIDDLDWRDAEYAIADGVKLYRAPIIGPQISEHVSAAIAEHNAAAINAWHEDRRAARQRWRASNNQSDDVLRKRAVGLLGWKHDKLAALQPDTTRDNDTSRAIWYLAGLVNDNHLDRDQVMDAILDASQANLHIPGNKTAAQVRDDVDRGLSKAQHGFDWDRMKDRPGWAPHGAEPEHQDRRLVPVDSWPDYRRSTDTAGETGETESNDQAAEPDVDDTPVLAAQLLTRSDLRNLPDPQPLIDNVLDQGTTAYLYGKWGTAKTFTALDWAASVATGRKWQNRDTVQRRTLYVVGEGAFGFKGRAAAWELGWQTKIPDQQLSILPVPVNLTRPVQVGNLLALVDWGGYSFIILDTLARCMVGADENSAKDCGLVVDVMTRLLARTPGGRGVVLGVHHAGKDGKTFRGSSVFEAAADTVYFTERDGAVITLDREKRKDGPESDFHELKIDPMPGTGSAVLSVSRGVDIDDRAGKLMSIFVQHFSATGATKSELRATANEAGMPNTTFHRAMSDLLTSKRLTNTGTDQRPFYKEP